MTTAIHHHVAIIGSGFAGVLMGIRLRQIGVTDFVIFERASDLGGVWRENTYPGCACDVESHLYALKLAPNPDWSRRYSPQAEIWDYLRKTAERFGVTPHIRYAEAVEQARWDDVRARWQLTTRSGSCTATHVIAATGALADPRMPDLPGLHSFTGPVFHSAVWDHSVDLAGKGVGMLGTGASAVQFVPAIQPIVGRLVVFQRTPGWVVPREDHPWSSRTRAMFRCFPTIHRTYREFLRLKREAMGISFWHPRVGRVVGLLASQHLRRQVRDPVLRKKLTPDFAVGCKRILVSDDWYPALTQPNVELIASAAERITPSGVVGADGIERPADVLICGTGFRVTDFPFAPHVTGRGGRTLAEVWAKTATAHVGTTVAGFPNLFIIPGPNTGLGHSSVLMMMEAQAEHAIGAMQYVARAGGGALEPRPEAQAAFAADVDRRMAKTVWVTGGCKSWYLDSTGRNSTLWPGTIPQFERRVARFRPEEYEVRRGCPSHRAGRGRAAPRRHRPPHRQAAGSRAGRAVAPGPRRHRRTDPRPGPPGGPRAPPAAGPDGCPRGGEPRALPAGTARGSGRTDPRRKGG
jgi:cation diffusion facilitator CzcD-associated flavoprotein CzcO